MRNGFIFQQGKSFTTQHRTATLKLSYFTKNHCTYGKTEKGLKNYIMAKLCPAHHINVTATLSFE